MAYELLVAPTTASVTTLPKSYIEADQIIVVANGLATTETVSVQVVGSLPATTVSGAASTDFLYQCTAVNQAIVVPGGFIFQFVKTTTAATVGVEIHMKPRIGGGAS